MSMLTRCVLLWRCRKGDSFGPVICAIWLSAAARFLERTLPGNVTGSGAMSIFMDDREFTAGEPGFLRAKFDAWTVWSRRAGLVESGDKSPVFWRKSRSTEGSSSLL